MRGDIVRTGIPASDGCRVGGGGGAHVVHGRIDSPMNVDPRVPTMPVRSTPSFTDRVDIACAKR